jgi:hypothetical protein
MLANLFSFDFRTHNISAQTGYCGPIPKASGSAGEREAAPSGANPAIGFGFRSAKSEEERRVGEALLREVHNLSFLLNPTLRPARVSLFVAIQEGYFLLGSSAGLT